jgi:hypothetical protein
MKIMSKKKKTVFCATCGTELELQDHSQKENMVVAYCNCTGTKRAVYSAAKQEVTNGNT